MFDPVRGPWVAAAALLSALLVGACSGSGDKPTTLPTLSTSPSVTPEPTATPSELQRVTTVGHQWFALIQGPTTIDTADAIEHLTLPSCQCRAAASSIRQAVAKHERYFGTITLKSFAPTIDNTTHAEIVVTYDSSYGGLKSADGRVISSSPARQNIHAVMRLVQSAGLWRLAAIETITR